MKSTPSLLCLCAFTSALAAAEPKFQKLQEIPIPGVAAGTFSPWLRQRGGSFAHEFLAGRTDREFRAAPKVG